MFGRQTKRSVGAESNVATGQIGSTNAPSTKPLFGVSARASSSPEAVALVDRSRSLTYGELESRASKLAHSLQRIGVKATDRIVMKLPRSFEQLETTVAVAKLGSSVVPLNPNLKPEDFARAIGDIKPCLVVSDEVSWNQLLDHKPELSSIKCLLVVGPDRAIGSLARPGSCEEYESSIRSAGPGIGFMPAYAGARLSIYNPEAYGAGGVLKESWVDQEAIATAQQEQVRLWMLNEKDIYLLSSGAHHPGAGGWAQLTLYCGGTVVVMDTWSAKSWLELVERFGVTRSFLTPGQLSDLVDLDSVTWNQADLSSLRTVVHGGTQCSAALKLRVIERLAPVTLWGIFGDSDRLVSRISSSEWIEHPGSVGRPVNGISIDILSEDDKPCPPGVSGRVMWRLREKSHGVTMSKTPSRQKSDPVFGGRYIGHVDDGGYLYITDKASDRIRVGNTTVYPWEVENVIHGHREILDCVVFSVSDNANDMRLVALVVTKSKDCDREISEHCRKYLPAHRLPSLVLRVDHLERDDAGKIDRKGYAKRFLDGEWEESTQISVPAVVESGDQALSDA